MPFSSHMDITDEGIARITLSGDLDASVAAAFKADIEAAASRGAKRLVLLMQDLQYMSSAGLRALIFAKQKMGPNTDIYVVGAREPVLETMRMTGFMHSVVSLPEYDAAAIETL